MFNFFKNNEDEKYEGIAPLTPWRELYEDFKDKQKEVIIYTVICVVLSTFLSGILYQYMTNIFSDTPIYIFSSFKFGLTKSIFLSLIFFVMLLVAGFRVFRSFRRSFVKNYDDKYLKSKNATYGSSHFQTYEEMEEHFTFHDKIEDTTGLILGLRKDDNRVAEFTYPNGMNRNRIYTGTPGSGKSAAVIKTELYQAVRRGDSVICVDSKGAIYADTSATIRSMGYVVRVLNLKPSEFKNSDAFNPLVYLKKTDDDLDSKAAVIATAIIKNTQTRDSEYWGPNEFNLLKAIIMLLVTDEVYLQARNNNLPYITEFLNQTPEELKPIFQKFPKGHPIRSAYEIFAKAEIRNQGQIMNGLGIRIATLSNPILREVLSHDEIDLVLPMKKKCVYYVIISDTDETYKYIASIFFSTMINRQCDYSDKLTEAQKANQLTVAYLMDEYKATGGIQMLPTSIGVTRSRKMDMLLILQTIGQLYTMYEESEVTTILGCCPVKAVLATDDLETAQYFEKLLGEETVVTENIRIYESTADILHSHTEQQKTYGEGRKSLMSAADMMNGGLSRNEILYVIGGMPPVRLNKCFAEKSGEIIHPLEKKSKELGQKMPHRYKPKWRKLKEDAEAEALAKREARRIENQMANKATLVESSTEKNTVDISSTQRQNSTIISTPITSAEIHKPEADKGAKKTTNTKPVYKRTTVGNASFSANTEKTENMGKKPPLPTPATPMFSSSEHDQNDTVKNILKPYSPDSQKRKNINFTPNENVTAAGPLWDEEAIGNLSQDDEPADKDIFSPT